jgi:cell division protein FtsA
VTKDNLITVGLDIGTTKITTVIGEISADGTVDILGKGTVASEGIKRGAVVNLERAIHAIRNSVAAAERIAGVQVSSAYVSLAGTQVQTLTSHGLAAIRRGSEIGQGDVTRAIENALAVQLPPNHEVVHTLPQLYVVDGLNEINNPVGMQGIRLEVDVHIVTANSGPLANLRRCVQDAGVEVRGLVLGSLAAGMAVLDVGEYDHTVLVIDMGGGTTDVAVFEKGRLRHSVTIPIGGDHVTADLAQILKIPMDEAENVKRKYGAALPELADPDLMLEITSPSGSTHAISAFELSRIIKPRITEIFEIAREQIDQALGPLEINNSGGAVILTGGGSLLRGMSELARERFRMTVRVARPRGVGGLTDIVAGPDQSVAVGLVLYGAGERATQLTAAHLGASQAPEALVTALNGATSSGQGGHGAAVATELSVDPPRVEPAEQHAESKASEPRREKAARDPNAPTLGEKIKGFFKDWL